MKNIYSLVASIIVMSTCFGQEMNPQNNSTGTNQIIHKSTVSQGQITSVITSVPLPGNLNMNDGLPPNSTLDPGLGITGSHYCKSHELTKKHFEEQGIWNEFNEDYLHSLTYAQNLADQNQNKTPGTNTIAVIFHVVHDNGDALGVGTNVSNALIMQVFQDLTDDYLLLNANQSQARTAFGFNPANPGINFCLATQDPVGAPLTEVGVIRVGNNHGWYDSNGGEENDMKSSAAPGNGSDIWDRNKYLNILLSLIKRAACWAFTHDDLLATNLVVFTNNSSKLILFKTLLRFFIVNHFAISIIKTAIVFSILCHLPHCHVRSYSFNITKFFRRINRLRQFSVANRGPIKIITQDYSSA